MGDSTPRLVIYALSLDGVTHRYVGMTSRGLKERLAEHFEDARSPRGNRALHRWIRKHDEAAIKAVVLEEVADPDDLPLRERYWINTLGTFAGARTGGLNRTLGGGGISGLTHTAEAKAKIAAASRRTYPARIEATATRRRADLEAHCRSKGHERQDVVTPGGRNCCALCMQGNLAGKTPWNAGRPHSAESRRRMSESSMGQPAWNKDRTCTPAEVEVNRAAQLARYKDPAERAKGRANLARASHARWHVSRGRVSPDCALCAEAGNAFQLENPSGERARKAAPRPRGQARPHKAVADPVQLGLFEAPPRVA